jgi:hypothetical protein
MITKAVVNMVKSQQGRVKNYQIHQIMAEAVILVVELQLVQVQNYQILRKMFKAVGLIVAELGLKSMEHLKKYRKVDLPMPLVAK